MAVPFLSWCGSRRATTKQANQKPSGGNALPIAQNAYAKRFTAAQIAYQGKIRTFARQKFRLLPGFDKQDVESEILEVLWKACNVYDPNNGACFNTLFWTMAHNRVKDLHKAASRKMRVGDYDLVYYDQVDEIQRNDAYVEVLNGNELTAAITTGLLSPSAEDEALALMHVREIYRSRKTR